MPKVTLMCVQPCTKYYAWQVEVMLDNFVSQRIHEFHDIHCIFAYNTKEEDYLVKVQLIKKLELKYQGIAQFFFYNDTREYPITYVSGIRPNALKQHFAKNRYLENERIFYHDCDIAFISYPDFFDTISEEDNNWYVSDTISYIGYDYIISKGEDVLDLMCGIVGINKELVKRKQNESGGAQYFLKGVDWQFFHKMEKDCETMFREINILNNQKKKENPTYHELQIWCSDMWSILWSAWMRGYDTKVIPEMEFCWATDTIEKWEKCYIFHNAGVTDNVQDHLFYKAKYHSSYPYGEDFSFVNKNQASFKYVEMIEKTSKNTCL